MPIHLRDNPYPGVNAHLHSFLAAHRSDWPNLHGAYIEAIRIALDQQLPDGYFALNEKSLQISESFFTELPQKTYTRADMLIMGDLPPAPDVYSPLSPQTGTLILPLTEVITDGTDNARSVVIAVRDGDGNSRPVTRIELLSPSNKPYQGGYESYIAKREETLLGGVRVVELDLLHEQRATIPLLPDYSGHEPNAFPYLIAIFDPYPTALDGQIFVVPFHVDLPIPTVDIPLIGRETLQFDFNAPYRQVVGSMRYVYLSIDYAEPPNAFESYSAVDQQRIRTRMDMLSADTIRPQNPTEIS